MLSLASSGPISTSSGVACQRSQSTHSQHSKVVHDDDAEQVVAGSYLLGEECPFDGDLDVLISM